MELSLVTGLSFGLGTALIGFILVVWVVFKYILVFTFNPAPGTTKQSMSTLRRKFMEIKAEDDHFEMTAHKEGVDIFIHWKEKPRLMLSKIIWSKEISEYKAYLVLDELTHTVKYHQKFYSQGPLFKMPVLIASENNLTRESLIGPGGYTPFTIKHRLKEQTLKNGWTFKICVFRSGLKKRM